MIQDDAAPLWIPERLVGQGDQMRCRWVDGAGLRFTDPFFDSTIARRRRDDGSERITDLQAIVDEAAAVPAPTHVTFIFHVSRCGSTLLSQLFSLDDRTVVLSEVPLFDAILGSGRSDRDALLSAALRLLGRAHAGATRVVVKTDCWHLFYATAIRRTFPDARFILLYRSPAGVLSSQQRMRGRHMVPGVLTDAPFDEAFDARQLTLDQYAARVLQQHYAAMLDVSGDAASLLVSYHEGFPSLFFRSARWIGLSLNNDQRGLVEERCGRDAKQPHERFDPASSVAPAGVDLGALEALVTALDRRRMAAGITP